LLAKKDETGTFLFLPWVLQNGGTLATLDSPESIAALAFWTDLVKKAMLPKQPSRMDLPRSISNSPPAKQP